MNGFDFDSALVRGVLEALLPILVTSLTSWVLVLVAKAWQELELLRPDVTRTIRLAAEWVIPVVEQLKSTGVIPDNETAKRRAVALVEKYLASQGIKVDLDRYADIIDNSIEGALREYKQYHPALAE